MITGEVEFASEVMDDFRVSFFCFVALAMLLPGALGSVLWRRFGRHEKALHATIASMAALAFVIGALWWTAIDPALWPKPAPAAANQNAPPLWGLAILAGVAGVICLTLGTVVAVTILAILDRAVPGTFAHLTARLFPAAANPPAKDPDPTPDP